MGNSKAILIASIILLQASPLLAQVKKPIVVAVIDTGINQSLNNSNFLCKFGHKDFTGTGMEDRHGHGTNISGLIDQYVKGIILKPDGSNIKELLSAKANYCQVILKYYDPKVSGMNNLKNETDALRYAINIKVNYINFSGGGLEFDKEEKALIKEAIDMGIKVVVAAGNEKSDIDVLGKHYYPAYDDPRQIIVGNLDGKRRAPTSNYGKSVNTWEQGTNQYSLRDSIGVSCMTGTSQATAIKSGKLIHEKLSH